MSITPIPADLKMAVIELHGWNCLCCGRPTHRYPDSRVRPDTLSFDHVIPEKFGGLTIIENLQPLCMACNLHKGIQTIDLRAEAGTWHRVLKRAKELNGPDRFPDPLEAGIATYSSAYIKAPKVWGTSLWKPRKNRPLHPIWSQSDVKQWNWSQLRRDVRSFPPCPVREKILAEQGILTPSRELVSAR